MSNIQNNTNNPNNLEFHVVSCKYENDELALCVLNNANSLYYTKTILDSDLKSFKNKLDFKNFTELCNSDAVVNKCIKKSYEMICTKSEECIDDEIDVKFYYNIFNAKILIEQFKVKRYCVPKTVETFDLQLKNLIEQFVTEQKCNSKSVETITTNSKLKNLKTVFSTVICEMKQMFEQISLEECDQNQFKQLSKKIIEKNAILKLKQQFFTTIMQFKEDDDSVTQDDYMLVDNYVQKENQENQENKQLQQSIYKLTEVNDQLQKENIQLQEVNKQSQNTINNLKKDIEVQQYLKYGKYLFLCNYKTNDTDTGIKLQKYVLIDQTETMIDFTKMMSDVDIINSGYNKLPVLKELHGLCNLKQIKYYSSTLPTIFGGANQHIYENITDIEVVIDDVHVFEYNLSKMNKVVNVTFATDKKTIVNWIYYVTEYKKYLPLMQTVTFKNCETSNQLANELVSEFCKKTNIKHIF